MTDMPIQVTIRSENPTGQYESVRITGMDHLQLVFQLDFAPLDFLKATMGQEVIAALSRRDAP